MEIRSLRHAGAVPPPRGARCPDAASVARFDREPSHHDFIRFKPAAAVGKTRARYRCPTITEGMLHMTVTAIVTIAGRSLLALLFILAGVAKIAGPQPFLDHMAEHHIPGVLLPLVILLELGAGTALLLGW